MIKPTRIFLADLSHTYSVSSLELMVPLNIGYIKAYTVANLGDAVQIDLFKCPQKLLDRVAGEQPDIIGFSYYSWNASLNWHIGREVRKALPGALIVAGGPNIDEDGARRTALLKKHSFLDFLVIDGGEEPFHDLVKWWRSLDRDRNCLPNNLAWLGQNGEAISTPLRPTKKIIDDITSPYLTGCLDEFLDAGMVPLFETNRGCPFKCSFCAWGAASKDMLRRMDFDTALAEMEYVASRSSARNWTLCDANFGILKRDVEIARKIRALHDGLGIPVTVQTFLAKNVTERNLEIGELLNDMTTATMSFQSLDEQVLKNIERGNISLNTYTAYQKRFFDIKHRTYSELIIPLPGETRATHIAALRTLVDSGVHELHVHNLRMLAGTKINSQDSWLEFGFRSRFRIIHGDAGIYRYPDGTAGRVFEYEESLRETNTMSETDLFYFRKLQFFIEFSWNFDVYGPLLKVAHRYGVHPIDVLVTLVNNLETQQSQSQSELRCMEFYKRLQTMSEAEWFDSADEIEAYFAREENFERLLNMEFDKLNLLGAVILLQNYKPDFDSMIKSIIEATGSVPKDILDDCASFTFSRFPSLAATTLASSIDLPINIRELPHVPVDRFKIVNSRVSMSLYEGPKRKEMRTVLERSKTIALSKILNTQRFYMRDLRLNIESNGAFPLPFLYCTD